MTFSIFSQRLTFPTNTCQRLRRILNLVEHSTMELFREIFNFCKIHKETLVLESHFNKVTGLYPATSLKERTPTQVFSGEFCEILKTPILQNTSRRLLLLYGKKFQINKIVKNPLRKGNKTWKQLVRKTTTQTKQKHHHYLHQVFIPFYYSKVSFFLFSLLAMIY